MTPYLKKLFEQEPELEASWREQLEDHPMLGQTSWTQDQIDALDRAHDEHHENCSKCRTLLNDADWPEHEEENCWHEDGECYMTAYCPEGQRTLKAWLDADQEYSWQEDFPNAIQLDS